MEAIPAGKSLLSFYAAPGPMTDAGEHADLFDGLPTDLAALCQIVQDNLLHIFWAERYGVTLSEEQKQTVNVRSVADKLAILRRRDRRRLEELRPRPSGRSAIAATSP